ncbi:hypothetical protein CVT26_008727 [Gymnopilus dilepis]|uniref:Uncharacterized protein n=1 Tax=Gymnopilus dilepis TaxID=231916 RepID=A0A409YGA4_9AGAR|nr:hypothetical protein CVT26_008727 [Gymnopilus dilepis]
MPEFDNYSVTVNTMETGKGYPAHIATSYKEIRNKFFTTFVPADNSELRENTAITVSAEPTAPSDPALRLDQLGKDRFTNWPPSSWRKRAKGEHYEYLMNPPKLLGRLIVRRRGKLLVVAAGTEAACISLGLEGHIVGMRTADFQDIIAGEVDGPNEDPEKAAKIRTFLLPDRFVTKGSSTSPRHVKIFAAWISSEWVWALLDFSGLVRIHVKSKSRAWTEADLAVGSPEWKNLFKTFNGSPDWILEKDCAIKRLRKWRDAILQEYSIWKEAVAAARQRYDQELRQRNCMADFFDASNPGRRASIISGPGLVLPPQTPRPIIREICSNSMDAFSGFGRHLANDFLHQQVIFPGTPAYIICEDEATFKQFENGIYDFFSQFTTPKFFRDVGSVPNSKNPFEFNELSNTRYMQKYITVFRRAESRITRDHYYQLCERGLLDPEHTIGDPYPESKAQALKAKFDQWRRHPDSKKATRREPVHFYGGNLRAYSAIVARAPAEWNIVVDRVRVTRDITTFGYTTTIGIAQFREYLLNRIIYREVRSSGGRRARNKTGQGGRPTMDRTTRKSVDASNNQALGLKKWQDGINPEDLVYEYDSSGRLVGIIPDNDDDNPGDANRNHDTSSCAYNITPFTHSPFTQFLQDMYKDDCFEASLDLGESLSDNPHVTVKRKRLFNRAITFDHEEVIALYVSISSVRKVLLLD